MIEELKKAARYASTIIGSYEFTERDFVYALSYRANEMSPEDAKALLRTLVAKKILKSVDGRYALNFNPKTIRLPVDYSIPDDLLKVTREHTGMQKPPFERILEEVCSDTGMEKRELIARANRIQAEMGNLITPEAALVVAATEAGGNPKKYAGVVKEGLVQHD
jgi:hypothetical protein